MPRRAPNYIWQHSVHPAWLEKYEARLEEATASRFAIIERPNHKRVLVQSAATSAAEARRLQREFGGKLEKLPRDWLAQYSRALVTKPIRIGQRLQITSDQTGPGLLRIPAGAAFGTGEHATTAMSLRMLERRTRGLTSGWRMLDAGTGSGILALAGRRFGAREVLAIDNDPLALATAQENARRNGIRGVQFEVADVHRAIKGHFAIITANLYSDLLIEVLPQFRKALEPGGCLILSGIMHAQERGVIRALRAAGFAILETRRRGKWIALAAALAQKRG